MKYFCLLYIPYIVVICFVFNFEEKENSVLITVEKFLDLFLPKLKFVNGIKKCVKQKDI